MTSAQRLVRFGWLALLLSIPLSAGTVTVGAFTQAAIVTAISSACNGTVAGTVLFPNGTYPVASAISIPAVCTLQAQNNRLAIIQGSTNQVFSVNGDTVTIDGLVMDAGRLSGASSRQYHDIAITNNTIRNWRNSSQGGGPEMVYFWALLRGNISNNTFSNIWGGGNLCCTITLVGSENVDQFGALGVHLDSADQTLINNNTFDQIANDATKVTWQNTTGNTGGYTTTGNVIAYNIYTGIHRIPIELQSQPGGAGSCPGGCNFSIVNTQGLQVKGNYMHNYQQAFYDTWGASLVPDGSKGSQYLNNTYIVNYASQTSTCCAAGQETSADNGTIQGEVIANVPGGAQGFSAALAYGANSSPSFTILTQENAWCGNSWITHGGTWTYPEGSTGHATVTEQYNYKNSATCPAGANPDTSSIVPSWTSANNQSFPAGGNGTWSLNVVSNLSIRYVNFFIDAQATPVVFQEVQDLNTNFATDRKWLYHATFSTTGLATSGHTINAVLTDVSGATSTITQAFTVGSITGPDCCANPSTLSYTAAGPLGTLITNSGTTTLSITGITITGPNAGDFSQTNTCGTTLAVGVSCAVTITFAPTATGTRTATLAIANNSGVNPSNVTLTGTTAAPPAPIATVSPTSLAYTQSGPLTTTLTNTGTALLSITTASITGANIGDFSQTSTCGATLAAGASCVYTVTFSPTAGGTRSAALSITHNAAGSPTNVPLSGSVVAGPSIVHRAAILPAGGLNYAPNPVLQPSSITITTWVMATTPTTGTFPALVSYGNDAGSPFESYMLQAESFDGTKPAQIRLLTGAGTVTAVLGTTHMTAGVLYFIAGTYDGQTVSIYVNGVLENSVALAGSIFYPTTIGGLGLGRKYSASANGFNGTTYGTQVFNGALTASQIAQINTDGVPQVFYASTTGNSGNAGTLASPWDLTTALNKTTSIKSGDVLYIRAGTYTGNYTCTLTGSSVNPIIVAPYPGERVTIDNNTGANAAALTPSSSYVWYEGLELMSSSTSHTSTQAGSQPTDIPFGEGITIDQTTPRSGNKFIDLIIHDTRQGISWWKEAVDSEIYGVLSFYNGWDSTVDRAHGHGFYIQNLSTSSKQIHNSINFRNWSHGMQEYGSSTAPLNNTVVDSTIWYNNGEVSSYGLDRNVLIGGDSVATGDSFTNNVLFTSKGKFGYTNNILGATITGNYFDATMELTEANVTDNIVTGNTFAETSTYGVTWTPQSVYPSNTYIAGRDTGLKIGIQPNLYEAGRANITIFNWNSVATASLDFSGFLNPGDQFQIVDTQNYYGTPLVTGTWTGTPITVPLNPTAVTQAKGSPVTLVHTPTLFNSYVIYRVATVVNVTGTCNVPSALCTGTPGQTIQLVFGSPVTATLMTNSVGTLTTVDSTHANYTVPNSIANAKNTLGGCMILPNDSIYNTRIDSLPVHASSGTWITGWGAVAGVSSIKWVSAWDTNVIDNTATTIASPLWYYTSGYNGQSFQIPTDINRKRENGSIAQGTINYSQNQDHHLVSINHQTCQIYETYQDQIPISGIPRGQSGTTCSQLAGINTGCTAQSGYQYNGNSYGVPTNGTTAAAAQPDLAMTWRADEINSGSVNHALRITIGNGYCNTGLLWPATSQMSCGNAATPPSGARIRMKAAATCPLATAAATTMCTALKQYGAILDDITAGLEFTASLDLWYDPATKGVIGGAGFNIPLTSLEFVDESSLELNATTYAVKPNNGFVVPSNSAVIQYGTNLYQPIALVPVTVGTPERYIQLISGFTYTPIVYVNGTTNTSVTWTATGGGSFSGGVYTPPVANPGDNIPVTLTACSTVTPTACTTMQASVYPSKCKASDTTIRVCIDSGSTQAYAPDVNGDFWSADGVATGGVEIFGSQNAAWQFQVDGPLYYTGLGGTDIIYHFANVPNGNYKVTFKQGIGYDNSGNPVCNFNSGWPSTYYVPGYGSTAYGLTPWPGTPGRPMLLGAQGIITNYLFDPGLTYPLNNGYQCFTRSQISIPADVLDNTLTPAMLSYWDAYSQYAPYVSAMQIEADATPPFLLIDLATQSPIVKPGGTVQLYAQFWYTPAPAPCSAGVTWSIVSGPGTITSPCGLFTAPGAVTITTPTIVQVTDGNGHTAQYPLTIQGAKHPALVY